MSTAKAAFLAAHQNGFDFYKLYDETVEGPSDQFIADNLQSVMKEGLQNQKDMQGAALQSLADAGQNQRVIEKVAMDNLKQLSEIDPLAEPRECIARARSAVKKEWERGEELKKLLENGEGLLEERRAIIQTFHRNIDILQNLDPGTEPRSRSEQVYEEIARRRLVHLPNPQTSIFSSRTYT